LVKKPGFLSFCALIAFNANPQLLLETPPEIDKSFSTNKKEDENLNKLAFVFLYPV